MLVSQSRESDTNFQCLKWEGRSFQKKKIATEESENFVKVSRAGSWDVFETDSQRPTLESQKRPTPRSTVKNVQFSSRTLKNVQLSKTSSSQNVQFQSPTLKNVQLPTQQPWKEHIILNKGPY